MEHDHGQRRPEPCEPADFWMRLEARFQEIEFRLAGGLSAAEVMHQTARALALAKELRLARTALERAIRAARHPIPTKETRP